MILLPPDENINIKWMKLFSIFIELSGNCIPSIYSIKKTVRKIPRYSLSEFSFKMFIVSGYSLLKTYLYKCMIKMKTINMWIDWLYIVSHLQISHLYGDVMIIRYATFRPLLGFHELLLGKQYYRPWFWQPHSQDSAIYSHYTAR